MNGIADLESSSIIQGLDDGFKIKQNKSHSRNMIFNAKSQMLNDKNT